MARFRTREAVEALSVDDAEAVEQERERIRRKTQRAKEMEKEQEKADEASSKQFREVATQLKTALGGLTDTLANAWVPNLQRAADDMLTISLRRGAPDDLREFSRRVEAEERATSSLMGIVGGAAAAGAPLSDDRIAGTLDRLVEVSMRSLEAQERLSEMMSGRITSARDDMGEASRYAADTYMGVSSVGRLIGRLIR